MAYSDGRTERICSRRIHTALSLPEVLVVIAIIVLLLAILMPSVSAARERARRVLCAGNLRQWGLATHMYRADYNDSLPMEGTFLAGGIERSGTWYNELPIYLGLPAYKDLEGANVAIRELPAMHVWICPSKNLTEAYKSSTGKNQFHYGMNQVLDGMGPQPGGSPDTPGFPDPIPARPVNAIQFLARPNTVLLFDIAPNSMRGSPRDVATQYWRDFNGGRPAKFHGDFANILYLHGGVTDCRTADLVVDHDNRFGRVIWNHPRFYWGYTAAAR